ncbi:MAG: acyl carrier protein [Clostridia bacterium]|jgi:acyl carrier protein|nr:acyl carrier protein [Clostridia bacterium]
MEFEKVRQIIANQLDLDPAEITMDSNLIEDLRADSLDIVELVMDMEQEFDVEIPDEELPKVKTVGDIVRYLQNR